MNAKQATVETLKSALQAQTDLIDRAIGQARQDILVDISSLDDDVSVICDGVGRLEESDAKKLETALAAMIGRLEDLAQELKAFQDRNG